MVRMLAMLANSTKANSTKAYSNKAYSTKAYSTKAYSTKAYSTKAYSCKVNSTKANSTKANSPKANPPKAFYIFQIPLTRFCMTSCHTGSQWGCICCVPSVPQKRFYQRKSKIYNF